MCSDEECSDDVELDPERDDSCLRDQLASWAHKFQVKHNAVDDLLKRLKQSGHPDLPGTARSLLSTTRVINIEEKSGMEYIYFPIEEALMKHFLAYPMAVRENVDCLNISLNIDGLPLFKSSRGTLRQFCVA